MESGASWAIGRYDPASECPYQSVFLALRDAHPDALAQRRATVVRTFMVNLTR
jgi:hypothetical protein